jgi:hypothetical protein
MSEEKVPGTVSVPMADPEDTIETSPYDAGVEDLSNVKINAGGDPEIPFVDPKVLTGNDEEETEEEGSEEPENEPVKVEQTAESRAEEDEVEDAELITPFVDAFAQELG